MNIRVSNILQQKINMIQSRVPIKFASQPNSQQFTQILNEEINTLSSPNHTTYSPKISIGTTQQKAHIEKVINEVSAKYDVHPSLIKAIIKAESNFNPNALSSKGAQGLMQLMPGTAEALGVQNPWNIAENIEGGVKYFKEKLNQFSDNIDLALAAYNAGPNNVIKYNGVPPYTETQNYIKNVRKYFEDYNSIY